MTFLSYERKNFGQIRKVTPYCAVAAPCPSSFPAGASVMAPPQRRSVGAALVACASQSSKMRTAPPQRLQLQEQQQMAEAAQRVQPRTLHFTQRAGRAVAVCRLTRERRAAAAAQGGLRPRKPRQNTMCCPPPRRWASRRATRMQSAVAAAGSTRTLLLDSSRSSSRLPADAGRRSAAATARVRRAAAHSPREAPPPSPHPPSSPIPPHSREGRGAR